MNTNAIVRISDENPSYSSMPLATRAEKVAFYNAVENPKHKLSSFINKKIKFSNVYMEQVNIAERDEDGEPTGVMNTAIKTVLITPEGDGILTTSMGVARSLYAMFQIFGTPDTWSSDDPMIVEVKQVEIGKNRTFKLEVC